MARLTLNNLQITDAVYSGSYGKPTLQLTIVFDEPLIEGAKTKLKKLLNSQNENLDIRVAMGLQTYIPGARAYDAFGRIPGSSGRYLWGITPAYRCNPYRYPEVDHIFYDDVATVVFWTDGTKTVVKCPEGTPYDEYSAFCAALAKKIYGNNSKLQREIKKKARYSKKRQGAKIVCGKHFVREESTIFYPYKADQIIGKVASVKETDKGLEVEVTKND